MSANQVAERVCIPVIRCETCSEPYALKWCISLGSGGGQYAYFKMCRHKTQHAASVPVDDIEWARLNAPTRSDNA